MTEEEQVQDVNTKPVATEGTDTVVHSADTPAQEELPVETRGTEPEVVGAPEVVAPPENAQMPVTTNNEMPVKNTRSRSARAHGTPESRVKARAAMQRKIEIRLDRVMEYAQEKGEIRNDDVEKLLEVSDNTAMRYLGMLMRQGKLKRIGRTGRWVKYEVGGGKAMSPKS